jgi:hypothetical protein
LGLQPAEVKLWSWLWGRCGLVEEKENKKLMGATQQHEVMGNLYRVEFSCKNELGVGYIRLK